MLQKRIPIISFLWIGIIFFGFSTIPSTDAVNNQMNSYSTNGLLYDSLWDIFYWLFGCSPMAVDFNATSPDFNFYLVQDTGDLTKRFTLRYLQLIEYYDNNEDSIYSSGVDVPIEHFNISNTFNSSSSIHNETATRYDFETSINSSIELNFSIILNTNISPNNSVNMTRVKTLMGIKNWPLDSDTSRIVLLTSLELALPSSNYNVSTYSNNEIIWINSTVTNRSLLVINPDYADIDFGGTIPVMTHMITGGTKIDLQFNFANFAPQDGTDETSTTDTTTTDTTTTDTNSTYTTTAFLQLEWILTLLLIPVAIRKIKKKKVKG